VDWTFIDDVAEATRVPAGWPGASVPAVRSVPDLPGLPGGAALGAQSAPPAPGARSLFLQRRSAVAFDAQTRLPAATFFRILRRVLPGPTPPWAAIWWEPRVHLVLFVHRVDGVPPGLYLLGRDEGGAERLMGAMRRDFTRENVAADLPLVRLAAGDCRSLARRLSCDQEIASDGCFAVAMIAEFDAALAQGGAPFYRHLFWETGVVGQVLYLEAEAAGLRATGIGCFYDDPVHDALGLEGHAFQSLYHFTIGGPVEDARITAEPGYGWERS
jgi:nitroreductase